MTEPSEEQREALVVKVSDIFKGLEIEVINKAVEEVMYKVRLYAAEEIKKRRGELAKLFDSQMETLRSRGCLQEILETFYNHRDIILSKTARMKIPEGHIPFMPVIPRAYLGIYGLMPMVRHEDEAGYTLLNPNEIGERLEQPPKFPYFILDVEDGTAMLNQSPDKAENLILRQKRRCLIAEEGIALCIHTNVLSKHGVDCTGSGIKDHSSSSVFIGLNNKGKPQLCRRYRSNRHSDYGSASCHERF